MECLTIDTWRSPCKLSHEDIGKTILQSKALSAYSNPVLKEVGKKVVWDSYAAETQYSRNVCKAILSIAILIMKVQYRLKKAKLRV